VQALFTLTPGGIEAVDRESRGSATRDQNAKKKGYLLVGRVRPMRTSSKSFWQEDQERRLHGRPVIKGVRASGTGRADQARDFPQGTGSPVEPGSVLDKLSPGDIMPERSQCPRFQWKCRVIMQAGRRTMGQFTWP